MKRLIFIYLALLYGGSVWAQSINTDRPSQSESGFLVPTGTIQVESGILYMNRERELAGITTNDITYALPASLFRLGLSKRFELRVLSELRGQKSSSALSDGKARFGAADTQVGFKLHLLSNDEKSFGLSLLSHAILPTGNSNSSADEFGVINKLALSASISEKSGLGANLAYTYPGFGDGVVGYTALYSYTVTDNVSVFVENFGEWNLEGDLEFMEFSMDAGFAYLIANNVQLDYFFGFGLNHTMNFYSVGLSFMLPK